LADLSDNGGNGQGLLPPPPRTGKRPAFLLYGADYLADEAVIGMTLAQLGAYTLLLIIHSREGSIPAETDRIARLIRLYGHTAAFRAVWKWPLSTVFQPHPSQPGRLVQPRMFDDLQRIETLALHRSIAGVQGGRKSAELRREFQANAKQKASSSSASSSADTEEERRPSQERNPTQEKPDPLPICQKQQIGRGSSRSSRPTAEEASALRSGFDLFYVEYPRKVKPDAAERAFAATVRKAAKDEGEKTTPELIGRISQRIFVGVCEWAAFWGSKGWLKANGGARPEAAIEYPATFLNAGQWKTSPPGFGDDEE
jgi:uncharacterized protein YdaU (DUF1376 family)